MDLQHSKTKTCSISLLRKFFLLFLFEILFEEGCQLFALYDVGILFANSSRVIFNADNPPRTPTASPPLTYLVAVNMILTQSSLQRASSSRRRQLLTRQHCKLACDIRSCPWLSDCSVPCAERAPRSSWFSRPSTSGLWASASCSTSHHCCIFLQAMQG